MFYSDFSLFICFPHTVFDVHGISAAHLALRTAACNGASRAVILKNGSGFRLIEEFDHRPRYAPDLPLGAAAGTQLCKVQKLTGIHGDQQGCGMSRHGKIYQLLGSRTVFAGSFRRLRLRSKGAAIDFHGLGH